MYKTKKNEEIGKYLAELIEEKYDSQRQFCMAYLNKDGNKMPDSDAIQAMANRISQIIKGKKAVQLRDFPIFTELLGVTCEEILSAGECSAPVANRMTNYLVAFSRDKRIWEEYVHSEDKLLLNLDEYGKTVIEYALEFKNFDFLKYLIKNKYLWFVDAVTDSKGYFRRWGWEKFGVGTSIERRLPAEHDEIRWYVSYPENKYGYEKRRPHGKDTLKYDLAGNDNLRMRMISLAIENDDVELLDQLCAREIPSLYQACFITCQSADCDRYYDNNMLEYLERASVKVLDYFLTEFEIKDMYGYANRFLFPYMSDLIDIFIRKKIKYAQKLIKASIVHNKKVLMKVRNLKEKAISDLTKYYETLSPNKDYIESCMSNESSNIMNNLLFYENGNIIIYRDITKTFKAGMVTNIIHTNEKSKDDRINSLVQELNGLYDVIKNKMF